MSRRYRLIILLALLVVTLAAVTVVSAQTGVQVTTRDNVQLRGGPGTSFASLGTVPFNTALTALGRNEDASWIQVDHNGTVGWIIAYMLNVQGDVNSLPVGGGVVPPPPTEEPVPIRPSVPDNPVRAAARDSCAKLAPPPATAPSRSSSHNPRLPLRLRTGDLRPRSGGTRRLPAPSTSHRWPCVARTSMAR